jgi:aryl-alcohol dehydrogenase-like predicted oxidoreductase
MAERRNWDEMIIATKFKSGYMAHLEDEMIQSNYGGSQPKSLKLSVTHSLKKIQTDYIDIL